LLRPPGGPEIIRVAPFDARSSAVRCIPAWLLLASLAVAQPTEKNSDAAKPDAKPAAKSHPMAGLRLRSIGPAVTSGRVVGFAVHPDDRSHYYVAVASGGVWKTINAGTTWTPVFDNEGSYSIGCVTLDPKN